MLERCLAWPKNATVAVRFLAIRTVFGPKVTEQPHVKVSSRNREESKARVLFLAWGQSINPDPGNTVLLENARAVGRVPTLVAELNGQWDIGGPPPQELAQHFFLVGPRME